MKSASAMRWVIVAAVAMAAGTLQGAAEAPPATGVAAAHTTSLTVSPMAMAVPALQFELLPPERDVEAGNAATRYLSALPLLPKTANEDADAINGLLQAPLAALDEKAAQAKVDEASASLHITATAARTTVADWGVNLRREGMRALIPGLSPLRKVSNLLALSIRLDIKNHRWTEARDKLQTGFAMARHLGEGDTLVESLVGIGVARAMEACLTDWVQEPGAPNLFWPLCNVPAPFNDLRHPLAMERSWLFYQIPALRDFVDGRYSVDGWYRLVGGQMDITQMTTGHSSGTVQGFGLLLAVADYPQAKAALIARGASAEEVERRPVAAVVEEYFLLQYQKNADEVSKWDGVAVDQAIAAWESNQVEPKFFTEPPTNFADMVSRQIIPAVSRARFIAARLDRQLAILRIVEALRAYAAERGALPESLEALTVPLPPLDPVTGKPFVYEHEGAGVRLASPEVKDHSREDVWQVKIQR